MSCCVCACSFFFVFQQKTAYELRMSDWSSDVCSSDLRKDEVGQRARGHIRRSDHSAGVKAEIGFDAVHAIGGKAVFIAAFRRERIKGDARWRQQRKADRKSTRLNSSH